MAVRKRQMGKAHALTVKAQKLAILNHEMNEAKTEHDRYKKDLEAEMLDLGIDIVESVVELRDGIKDVRVSIDETQTAVVDMESLRGLVTEEQFIKIVSATQTSIVKHAGSAVKDQVVRYKKGKPALKMKVTKHIG